jgi:hypothetical protein
VLYIKRKIGPPCPIRYIAKVETKAKIGDVRLENKSDIRISRVASTRPRKVERIIPVK